MASAMKSITKLSSGLLNCGFNRGNFIMGGKRFLFSESCLGMDGYKRQRALVCKQFDGIEDTFRPKMLEYMKKEGGMLFTDDLKSMLYLMENNPEDIDLITNMLRKYNLQTRKLGMGSFIFGPVVMRTFYHLNNPDLALAMFNDPLLEGFFNQLTSFQVLLDLLFNNERYDDMITVHRTISEKYSDPVNFCKNSMTIIMAGCYKKNDRESFEYAMNVWKVPISVHYRPSLRSCTFLAALAISQGSPEIALEVLSGISISRSYVSVKSLKVAALADLDRIEDITPYFRMELSPKNTTQGDKFFFPEALYKVEAALMRAKLDESSELVKLFRLIETDFIYETSMDKFLCRTIERKTTNERNDSTRMYSDRVQRPARFDSLD